MRHAVTSLELHAVLERLGKALHTEHEKVANEQLPSRWVDLIHYLDDKERQQSGASRQTSDLPRRPEPPPEY